MTPTKLIDQNILTRGRYPRNDSLAKLLGCTVDEAQKHLDRHRKEHGERVRGQQLVMDLEGTKKEEKPKKERFRDKVIKAADWAVDSGTIATAIIIDLILSGICLWIMGPSELEKIAFVAIAFIIVLFGLRALVMGNFWLWLRCALVSGFLSTSFVLVGIDYQTNLTADDRELVKLETAETNAQSYLTELQNLQKTKGEGYKSQVEAQQIVFNDASAKASEYRRQVAEKPKKAPEIKAYDILLAVPKAIFGASAKLSNDLAMQIALFLFGMVFWILQETMYTTVVKPKKPVDTDHDRV